MKNLIVATILMSTCIPVSVFGQDASSVFTNNIELYKLKVSVSLDDYFVGYFTPPIQSSGHNFTTCDKKTRFVLAEEVQDPRVEIACDPLQNPLTFLTAEQFLGQAIGGRVYQEDGSEIGFVGSVLVDSKGKLASYVLVNESRDKFSLASAESLSPWSSGSDLTFLAYENPTPVTSIKTVEGDWLSESIQKSLAAITANNGAALDLKSAISQDNPDVGAKVLFPEVGVIPAESWLTPN